MFINEMGHPAQDQNFGFSVGSITRSIKKTVKGAVKIGGKGFALGLAPMHFIEGSILKVVPANLRKYIITPTQWQTNIATKPKSTINKAFKTVKEITYRPTYELTKKVLGPDTAGMVMPRWVNPEDVNIKPGTEAAMKFRAAQAQGEMIAMGVAGTISPPIGVAYGVYSAAKTVDELKKAEALMEERIAQEKKQMRIITAQQNAEIAGEMEAYKALEVELNVLEGQTKQTDAEIDEMAKANPDMEAPSDKKKAALTIGAIGAAGIAALALT